MNIVITVIVVVFCVLLTYGLSEILLMIRDMSRRRALNYIGDFRIDGIIRKNFGKPVYIWVKGRKRKIQFNPNHPYYEYIWDTARHNRKIYLELTHNNTFSQNFAYHLAVEIH